MINSLNAMGGGGGGGYIGDCIGDCCRVIKGDTSVQTIVRNSS